MYQNFKSNIEISAPCVKRFLSNFCRVFVAVALCQTAMVRSIDCKNFDKNSASLAAKNHPTHQSSEMYVLYI
jgi:hypothetical protein